MPDADEPPGTAPGARSTRAQDRIIAALRGGIRDRSLPPGSRLPTRRELQQRFDVASATLQRALDRLAADGFIATRANRGTFVVDHPPCAHHYGLVVPVAHGAVPVHFWTALTNEARQLSGAPGARRLSVYNGVDGNARGADYQRLVRDLGHGRLAGLVFAVDPSSLARTPVLTTPGIPRIAIMRRELAGVAAVTLDDESFITKALDHFRARRRTRVAVLSVPGKDGAYRERTLDALAARWLATRPYWWHTTDPGTAVGARSFTHLLMSGGPDDRPDALLILDDNLVEHATAGLIAAGVRVPGDVEVVAHCNFPWPTRALLPVRRLGYDARELLERCLAWIDAGGTPDTGVTVPARFADECLPS